MSEYAVFHQPIWRILDNSGFVPPHDALASFAVDDALCTAIGRGQAPSTVRTWIHKKTVVLGIQDTRLPHLTKGIEFLEGEGWRVIVRNSGGLAVVLDEGILNVSIVMNEKANRLTIEKGYETMVALVKELLKPYRLAVETGEIVGSYCPGRYDVSVRGKKFAGISQRRLRGGAAIQAYLCVTGLGSKRAGWIKTFYELAGNEALERYPSIQPETMASLSELAEMEISPSDLTKRLVSVLTGYGKTVRAGLNEREATLFSDYYKRIQTRNQKALLNIV